MLDLEAIKHRQEKLVRDVDAKLAWLIATTDTPALIAEAERLRELTRHLWALGMSGSEYERLVEWIKNPARQPPETAFTAGAVRTACRAIVESGILNKQ